VAARQIADQVDGVVVTVFPDGYAKYRTLGLRHCAEGACPFEHTPAITAP
jgi:hypothetical protein